MENQSDIEVQVRLPWRTICGLACTAMIYKLDFNRMCVNALRRYIMEDEIRKHDDNTRRK